MATDKKTPLRIINLQAENIKRLVAVNITPAGDVVEITGANGAGKSSVLDCIWWALEGASGITSKPIRKGQKAGKIRLDMGEYIVERTFKLKDDETFTTALTVSSPDGGKHSSPTTMVDGWLGSLSLDPLEFARKKPAEQFDALKGMVPGYDFEAMARLDKTDYDKRTDVNRRAKEKLAQVNAIAIPATVPTEKIDEAAIVAEIGEVGTFNAEIERRKERREQVATTIATKTERAEALRHQAFKLNEEAEALEGEVDVDQKKLAAAEALPEPKDVADLQIKLAGAKTNNLLVDMMAQRAQLQTEAETLAKESAALTEAMEARAKAKQTAIAEAKLPVDGLELGDGMILLDGQPFDQASDAQRLRTSMAIAMAENPRLHVIRVRDGSLLDENGMKLIYAMAAEHGFQVWIERVDTSGKVGFVLEDGHIKHAPEAKDEPQGDLLAKE